MISSYSLPDYKYLIFVLLLFLIISFNSYGQKNIIGVVDYMRVENPDEYLEVEKQWQKIHRERLKEGMIVGWAVYKIMFKTTEDPYNFITVSWYDSFSKLDKGIPDRIVNSTFPNMSKEEWKAFNDKTDNTRKRISSGVFHQRLTTTNGLDKQGTYYVINEINVKRGKSKAYINMCRDIFLPMYEKDIKNNGRTVWSIWEKWPGNMKDFQYGTADGYTSLDQVEPANYMKYFKEIHPDKDINEISDLLEEIRELINTEMWRLEYRIN